MIDFGYRRATSAADASASGAGARQTARFIAGGTNLVDLLKLDVERPTLLVDINPLAASDPSLATVSELPDGGLRLGALARMSDVAWDARVKERYPVVSQSLLLAASGQVRNMATMAGNVLQRTRCPYFRDVAMPCNKREPGSGCSAIGGVNRQHAVLGTSEHCIAVQPSDLAVALVALDAVVQVRGRSGARSIPFGQLHLLPGNHPERETVLAPGDLITAIDLPALPLAKRSLYLKVRDRASFAFALASAAVALDVQSGTIRGARVALGGVGTKPWRSTAAEHALVGKPATTATFQAASAAALADARPHKDNAFKVPLARRTLERALAEIAS
ncbi:MAG TPA: xanthine dehydrogenase family protein subunit M [Gemmatimonadaceae bacterium]|jgi:xanthine dehydrogenase YagS FAD-binding subunit|nr:xanthine dehydrogenase family protein subunit M [Gemmatimonadaceae bacterium]